jgi:hypothetical protein
LTVGERGAKPKQPEVTDEASGRHLLAATRSH